MNLEFCKKIRENFPAIYTEFLTKNVYHDAEMVDQLFEDDEVIEAFAKVVTLVYDGVSLGKNFDANIRKALEKYEELTDDKNLRYFLRLYTFYTSESKGYILDGDNYKQEKEADYFSKICQTCCSIYNSLQTDLIHGNRWWEYDSASTLRQQFLSNKLVIYADRLQRLCERYLGRRIDIQKELHLNQGKNMPPVKLIAELDEKMFKSGYGLVYSWVEKVNGKAKLVKSKIKPSDDIYYSIMYEQSRDESRQH